MPTSRFKGPLLASADSGAGLFENQDIAEPGRFHTTQYHEEFDSPSRMFALQADKGYWKQDTDYTFKDTVTGPYFERFTCMVSGTSAPAPAVGPTGLRQRIFTDTLGNNYTMMPWHEDNSVMWKYLDYYGGTHSDWLATTYLGAQGEAVLREAQPDYQNSSLGVIDLSSGALGSSSALTGVTIQNNGGSSNGPMGVSPIGNPTVANPSNHVASTIAFGCRINMYNRRGQSGIDAGADPYLKCNWFVGLSTYESYFPSGVSSTLYDFDAVSPQGPSSPTHAGFFMKGNDTGRLWAGCKGSSSGAGVHIDIGEMPPLREGRGGWVELGMKIVDADCFMIYRRDEGQSTRWKQVAEGMLPEGGTFEDGDPMYPTISNTSADQAGATLDESLAKCNLGVDYFFLNQKRDLFHPEWDGNGPSLGSS